MCGIVSINVFFRYILNFSLSWGDELAQILLVWMTFLGAAVAIRDKSHYTFDYLVKILSGRAKKVVILLSDLLVISTSMALIFWGLKVTYIFRLWEMPATGISRAFVYAACPVGLFFMVIYTVRNFINELYTVSEKIEITEGKTIL